MQVLTPGYKYVVEQFENKNAGQIIQFIEKRGVYDHTVGDTPPMNVDGSMNYTSYETVNDGTTNEELLKVLIDRVNFLQSKFPCRENAIVITKLEESLMWLNKRTAERQSRGVEGTPVK